MEISLDEFLKRAKALYGEDLTQIKFKCPHCKQIQTGQSVYAKVKTKEKTARYGILHDHVHYFIESECYSATCDWVAYGLFTSNILLIRDPTKPHNKDTKENCMYIFPLADDKEMLAAAGV